jgi:single stranded DNA-binding protein
VLDGEVRTSECLVSIGQTATLTTFPIATNEYRGGNNERTEYHPCVAWDRLAEITGQFLSKGQFVDVEGRLQTRQWDDDAGKGPVIVGAGPVTVMGRGAGSLRTRAAPSGLRRPAP